jgi:hypothetical protein
MSMLTAPLFVDMDHYLAVSEQQGCVPEAPFFVERVALLDRVRLELQGEGRRVILQAPPAFGKTSTLQNVALAVGNENTGPTYVISGMLIDKYNIVELRIALSHMPKNTLLLLDDVQRVYEFPEFWKTLKSCHQIRVLAAATVNTVDSTTPDSPAGFDCKLGMWDCALREKPARELLRKIFAPYLNVVSLHDEVLILDLLAEQCAVFPTR